jgi:putative PIN family toxin of toxin-antitoxin system
MRVVLDANVLLAGFGTHGLCEALVSVCLESHHLVLSPHILRETRRYLTTKFKMPIKQADEILLFLKEHAEIVTPTSIPSSACRDQNDLAVLGTAVAGLADILVTGDKDLLTLEYYQGIAILKPRACYEKFAGL